LPEKLIQFLIRNAPIPAYKDAGKKVSRRRKSGGGRSIDGLRQAVEEGGQLRRGEFSSSSQQADHPETMNPFADQKTIRDREMVKSNDLGMGTRLRGVEHGFQVLALRSTRIQLPMKHFYGDKLPAICIARLEQTATATRLGFVQEFVATREEVSVHLIS
jgi:hypothetical protein